MKKIIFAVLALAAVAGVLLFMNLGGVVRAAIEAAGTQALGVKVRVSGFNLSLAEKSARMEGLSIANPPGFGADSLLETAAISVALEGVENSVVVIREIVVDGMKVTYELGGKGSNFDAIQKNLRAAKGAQNQPSGGKEDNKVIIQKLKIIHAQLIPAVGGESAPVSLPDITISNIGSKGNPAAPAEVAAQVMNRVLAASSAAAVQSGLGGSVEAVKDKLKEGLKAFLP